MNYNINRKSDPVEDKFASSICLIFTCTCNRKNSSHVQVIHKDSMVYKYSMLQKQVHVPSPYSM